MLAHLRMLEGDAGGFAVDRLEHSLQTATRAYRGGEDDEYVVCALLHDIGDILGPYNHADIAAAVLKPFVSDANHWMVEKHGIFQGYYFFHHLGLDRNQRDQYAATSSTTTAPTFCLEYDQAAFDPSYDTLPLEFFEPAVREVLSSPAAQHLHARRRRRADRRGSSGSRPHGRQRPGRAPSVGGRERLGVLERDRRAVEGERAGATLGRQQLDARRLVVEALADRRRLGERRVGRQAARGPRCRRAPSGGRRTAAPPSELGALTTITWVSSTTLCHREPALSS